MSINTKTGWGFRAPVQLYCPFTPSIIMLKYVSSTRRSTRACSVHLFFMLWFSSIAFISLGSRCIKCKSLRGQGRRRSLLLHHHRIVRRRRRSKVITSPALVLQYVYPMMAICPIWITASLVVAIVDRGRATRQRHGILKTQRVDDSGSREQVRIYIRPTRHLQQKRAEEEAAVATEGQENSALWK